MSRLKIISIIALFAGPFFLIMTYLEATEKKQIDREGVETVAIPMAKSDRRARRGGRIYRLKLQYPVQGAGTQIGEVSVSRELYDKVDSQPILRIKYLKDNPAKLLVIGEPLNTQALDYVGLGVLVVGLGGTWWFFIRKSPHAQPTFPETA